jgi:hypothetical protein
MDYSMWDEFDWIPETLIGNCIVWVKQFHEKHGWGAVHQLLWNKDTMALIAIHKGTREMLRGATKSWRPSKRREYCTYSLSLQLAIECLGCDFVGWGAAYPEAACRAGKLLDDCFIHHSRTRLLDVYIPRRDEMGLKNELKELARIFGP